MNNLIRKYVLPILATSVCIAGVITLSGCSGSDGNPASGTIESAGGTAALEIRVGKVGTLAKQATISMEKLIVEIKGKDTAATVLRDTSTLSGHGATVVKKTFTGLTAPEEYTLFVKALDKTGKVIHTGSKKFSTVPGDTIDVALDLDAQYSMLRVTFSSIPDSVKKVTMEIAAIDTIDSSFAAGSRDSAILAYDYLTADSNGIAHKISLRASGIFYKKDTVLYAADTTVIAKSGIDTAFRVTLKWVGPKVPKGAATMVVNVGVIGTTSINAGFESLSEIPAITFTKSLPADTLAAAGDTVRLIVQWSGTSPYTVVWKKNGVKVDSVANLAAGIDTLLFNNIDSIKAGKYSVMVKNTRASASSGPCSLTVAQLPVMPTIVTQPKSLKVLVGDSIGISVVAGGGGVLSYKWYKNEVLLSGQNAPSLTFPSFTTADSGSYTCEVSNSRGKVTSFPGRIKIPDVTLVQYETLYSDSISPKLEIDEWWFRGVKGDTISIQFGKTVGRQCTFELFDANNNLIASVNSVSGSLINYYATYEIKDFILPATANFHLKFTNPAGDNTYNYHFVIVSPRLAFARIKSLNWGIAESNIDSINPFWDVDYWQFNGMAGDITTIRWEKTVGRQCTFELFDANKNLIASVNSVSGSLINYYATYEIKDFVLPTNGKYYIKLDQPYGPEEKINYQLWLTKTN
jgi:hypothetical protein